MRKRNVIGKATSIVLALALCVTSFTGCGKKKITEEDFAEAKKIDKNCIFKQEDFTEILGKGDTVDALGRCGDKIVAVCKTEAGAYKYLSFNPDGTDVNSCDIEGQKEDYITISTFDKEGNAYLVYKEHKGGDTYSSYLTKIDSTGNMVYKFDLSDEFENDPFFIRCLLWSDKYGLLCGMEDGVQTYDEQNGLKVLVDKSAMSGTGGILNMLELADNKLFVNYFDKSSYAQSFVLVDAENGKVEKKLKGFQEHSYYSFCEDKDGNVFAEDPYGVYKYSIEADKLEKLLDYRDSSINSDELSDQAGFVALNEKEIIEDTVAGDNGGESFIKLTKVNPEDVGDKTVITLSAMRLDRDIAAQIMEFNRSSDKYAIKVLDYCEYYDDYKQMEKQFNLDITSGKAADIICLSGNESSIRKYADKGILLDLTSAFENGGPLGDIEILPNIKEMMKFNDKIYTFMPTFNFSSYIVKSEYAKGKTSLTYKDCDELIKSKGMDYKTAFGSLDTQSIICAYFWLFYGNEFFDLKNKKCNFNSPEFIEFLNFANKFPDEEPVDYVIYDDILADYANGKGIFFSDSFRDIWQYARIKQLVFRDDAKFVGCPNNLGKNLALISATTLAVNSKTEHADVIYDLIRELMTPEKKSSNGFSTVEPKFKEQLQEAVGEEAANNPDAETFDPVSGKELKLQPLTQEEVDEFYDYAVSIDTYEGLDMQVSDIILEEASAFFAGQKTAEQVAEIVQNRVTTYINENS